MSESLFDLRGSLNNYAYLKEQAGFTENGTFVDPTKDIDTAIMMSATKQYTLDRRSEVTSYPVARNNSTSSDHVREYGATISMEGVISDALFGLAEFLFSAQKSTTTEAKVADLKKLQKERKLVSVYLPDGLTVNNCVITQATFMRDKTVANGYLVNLSLQEMLVTSAATSEVKSEELASQASEDTPKGSVAGNGGALVPVGDATGVVAR